MKNITLNTLAKKIEEKTDFTITKREKYFYFKNKFHVSLIDFIGKNCQMRLLIDEKLSPIKNSQVLVLRVAPVNAPTGLQWEDIYRRRYHDTQFLLNNFLQDIEKERIPELQ